MKKQIVALFILSSSLAGCANQNHFHEYGDWVVNGDVHERLCSCGDKISESHDYDNGRVTKEATHVENGEKIFTCSTCGYEKSEVINKIEGHIFNQMVMNDSTKKKDADCSSPAEYYFSCICGVVSDTECFRYGNSTSHSFTSGITLSGTYKTSYFGGELFSFTGATFKGRCDIENKDVVLSENELSVIYQNNKTSFSCGDTKVTIALKSNPDVKKVLDVVVDHNLEWDFSSPLEDTCTCSICGENDVTFSKTLTSNVPQELETAKTCSLNLSGVSAYKSVVSIKLGKYDLGTNVNSLNFSSVNNDPEVINGKNQTITVVVKDLKDINHTISVPVKLCTKKISTEADVFSIAVGTATQGLVSDSGKYLLKGYYVQTNDIVITTGLTNSNYTFDWNYAFGGTYEGNNYTIKAKSAGWGVFGNLYNATVNNVKIEDSMYTG
ncbi:MAG: hypothetical protein MJ248_06410, partial [Bacilli bacterium]|nr:hypothetical protein [Bacilli bacterium]